MRSILQLGSVELFMKESKFLIYGNGKENAPTGFMFEKEQMHGLYFNQSPAKVLLRSISSVIHANSSFIDAANACDF